MSNRAFYPILTICLMLDEEAYFGAQNCPIVLKLIGGKKLHLNDETIFLLNNC